MSAYVIANVRLTETDRYQAYVDNVPGIIEKHGGRYLVRGGESTTMEGDWSPARFIVIEFPDRAAATAFYNDPDYVPFRTLRQEISDSALIIIDGYDE